MYTLTIVSMFKNESLILEEWLAYYIGQGVEHFYLIDNGSTDSYEQGISKHMDRITLVKDPFRVGPHPRTNKLKSFDNDENRYVYTDSDTHTQALLPNKHFLETIKNESVWTMFIDCDEYIYAPKSKNLCAFLLGIDRNSEHDGITDIFVPWKVFGSNDLDQQPKSIISGFNRRCTCGLFRKRALAQGDIRGHGKSIVRTQRLTLLGIHQCKFYTPRVSLMPDGSVVENEQWRAFMKNLNYNNHLVFCNHYMVMSKEYFVNHKMKRGRGAGEDLKLRGMRYWKSFNHNTEVDNELINYLDQVVQLN